MNTLPLHPNHISREQLLILRRGKRKANKALHRSQPKPLPMPLDINLITVKAIIQTELRLVDCPLNETFKNLAVTDTQLENLRGALYRNFGKSVRPLLTDTIYSYTDRLLSETRSTVHGRQSTVDGGLLNPSPERTILTAKQDPLI